MYYTLEHIERICRDLQQLIHQPASDITGIVWQQGLFTNPADAAVMPGSALKWMYRRIFPEKN